MSIPFESVVVALLTGIFGYAIAWFNNRSRIKAEERQRKEGQYYGFIGELIKCKSNDGNPMCEIRLLGCENGDCSALAV